MTRSRHPVDLPHVARLALLVWVLQGCDGRSTDLGGGPPGHERLLWAHQGMRAFGEPAAGLGKAYVTLIDHEVLAFELESGDLVWRTRLPIERPTFFGRVSVYADSLLIVGDEDVFAIDVVTGELRWHFVAPVGRNPGLFGPAVKGDLVITGSSSGHVFALDLASGVERWRTKILANDTVAVYRPIADDTITVVAFTEFHYDGGQNDRGGVAALETQTGRVLWLKYLPQFDTSISSTATIDPARAKGVVIAGSRDGPVYAFSVADGTPMWSLPRLEPPDGPANGVDVRPLAWAEGIFVVGTSGTALLGVEALSGKVLWNFTQGFGSTGWISVHENDLFHVYGGGQFELLDVRTGQLKWRNEERIASFPPAISDSILVFAGDGVHAFRR